MNKKKFLILVASLVVVFVAIYAVIFISGLGGYPISQEGGSGDGSESSSSQETETVIHTEISSVTGEVVEVQEDLVKIKSNISGREAVFVVNQVDNIDRVSGAYEDDRLVDSTTEEADFSDIEKGENLSISLQNPVRVEDLSGEEMEIEAEEVIINPSTNQELY